MNYTKQLRIFNILNFLCSVCSMGTPGPYHGYCSRIQSMTNNSLFAVFYSSVAHNIKVSSFFKSIVNFKSQDVAL